MVRRQRARFIGITHNNGVVDYLADHIAVMNRGRIEESGLATTELHSPQADFTRVMLAVVPRIGTVAAPLDRGGALQRAQRPVADSQRPVSIALSRCPQIASMRPRRRLCVLPARRAPTRMEYGFALNRSGSAADRVGRPLKTPRDTLRQWLASVQ